MRVAQAPRVAYAPAPRTYSAPAIPRTYYAPVPPPRYYVPAAPVQPSQTTNLESDFQHGDVTPAMFQLSVQVLQRTGASNADISSYLNYLRDAADRASVPDKLVLVVGCRIAALDGNLNFARRQVEVFTAIDARAPGMGAFILANEATEGNYDAGMCAQIRGSVDGLGLGDFRATSDLSTTAREIAEAARSALSRR